MVAQPRHGQRDVQDMLDVVIFGVAGVIIRVLAVIHQRQFCERARQRAGVSARKQPVKQRDYRIADFNRIRGAYGIGDIKITAPHV